MSISVELTAKEIATLKQLTNADNDSEAVLRAAREYLRLRQLRELKAVSGKVEYDANWQGQEELELGELGFPC